MSSKLSALLPGLIDFAIKFAETLHAFPKSGSTKLSTATTIIQTGLGVAVASGVITGKVATAIDIAAQVNAAVAAANASGGVPTLPAAPAAAPAK